MKHPIETVEDKNRNRNKNWKRNILLKQKKTTKETSIETEEDENRDIIWNIQIEAVHLNQSN